MTQEQKELLLKDLCARLLHNVVMTNKSLPQTHYILTGRDLDEAYFDDDWDDIPYLRSLSNMTEEERQEYLAECDKDDEDSITTPRYHGIDWLDAHYFDYRGLIPMDLAIAVTEENNPYKN